VAVAIADDGTRTAPHVRGKPGGQFHVWETANPATAPKSIHTQFADFSFDPYASLTFSREGKRLAGWVLDRKRLQLYSNTLLTGQVHVWELAARPKGQHSPRRLGKSESVHFSPPMRGRRKMN
jgi:hypothetical protein